VYSIDVTCALKILLSVLHGKCQCALKIDLILLKTSLVFSNELELTEDSFCTLKLKRLRLLYRQCHSCLLSTNLECMYRYILPMLFYFQVLRFGMFFSEWPFIPNVFTILPSVFNFWWLSCITILPSVFNFLWLSCITIRPSVFNFYDYHVSQLGLPCSIFMVIM
jgi:hypothetical protein